MSVKDLIVEIDNEIDRLNQAKALLGGDVKPRINVSPSKARSKSGHRMSAAARKKISLAQKARWAAFKK